MGGCLGTPELAAGVWRGVSWRTVPLPLKSGLTLGRQCSHYIAPSSTFHPTGEKGSASPRYALQARILGCIFYILPGTLANSSPEARRAKGSRLRNTGVFCRVPVLVRTTLPCSDLGDRGMVLTLPSVFGFWWQRSDSSSRVGGDAGAQEEVVGVQRKAHLQRRGSRGKQGRLGDHLGLGTAVFHTFYLVSNTLGAFT